MAWISKCHLYVIVLQCLLVNFFMLSRHGASGHKNKDYHISYLCKSRTTLTKLVRVSGAVVTAEGGEDSYDCFISFLTETVLDRLMLRFEWLALDCNDHLYLYDRPNAYGDYAADLSCLSTKADVGTITSTGNFLTLNYVTNGSLPEKGFRFVITSYKDSSQSTCDGYSCTNSMCINEDLKCDGVNHCGDNSDETDHASCSGVLHPLIRNVSVLNITDSSAKFFVSTNDVTQRVIISLSEDQIINIPKDGDSEFSVEINDLVPAGAYRFHLEAVSESEEYSEEWVEDVVLLPAAPEIIILSLKEGSLKLQWTVNGNTTGKILDYTISYGIVTMEQGKGWLYKSCLTNITIPSCAPPYYTISVPSSGEFYEIQIKARTRTGFGKSSNTLVFVQ